ncbi:sigma-70 family RNA polymerase sigma factor [Nocardia sp. NPDC088792]|uniref:sigma-70 family RNA polymerase sigma factor n=1 Tax=Nocardia sp. NPDC088792 TaxID=3364332 RepID=UPI003812DBC4
MTVAADVVTVAETHRAELLAYCYRMTGSLHDAEDLVQETLLRAWRAADSYDPQRASIRTWLYRIATNVCLTALKSAERRALPADLSQPNLYTAVDGLPSRPELPWLEPFPDSLLEGGDPAAVITARESVRLAFIAALQHLSPMQRAVLILRDVLALRAAEVAALLGTSTAGVNSALQRARAQLAAAGPSDGLPEPSDADKQDLLKRYVSAFESLDIEALRQLLREDALLQMPPFAAWFRGPDAIATFLASIFARGGEFRMLPTNANGRDALGSYLRRDTPDWRANNLHVLTLSENGIARMDLFHRSELFPSFGLPPAIESE